MQGLGNGIILQLCDFFSCTNTIRLLDQVDVPIGNFILTPIINLIYLDLERYLARYIIQSKWSVN